MPGDTPVTLVKTSSSHLELCVTSFCSGAIVTERLLLQEERSLFLLLQLTGPTRLSSAGACYYGCYYLLLAAPE